MTETIKEAKALYAQQGRESVYPGYRAVIRAMVESGFKGCFRNDSYVDALYLTEVMFDRARRSVCMLTGPGCDGFLSTLEDAFTACVERLKKAGGTFRIVILAPEMPAFVRKVVEEFPDTLKVLLAEAKTDDIEHLIVYDTTGLRVERPHGPLTDDTLATEIRADVCFNDPHEARKQERLFDAAWRILGGNETDCISDHG